MDEAKVKQIKSMIRAVIQSSKEGVISRRFNRDYYEMTGQNVPFRELGFTSLDGYLKSIPDTVETRMNRDGEKVYFAVADKSTAHLAKLISRQKSAKKRSGYKVKSFRRPTFPTPRRSYSRPSTSRYGPRATPRPNYYNSQSSGTPQKLRSVIHVTSTYSMRSALPSESLPKPSSGYAGFKYGSTYEVPPRFRKTNGGTTQLTRRDSSNSVSPQSDRSGQERRHSVTDPNVERVLKGIPQYKSVLNTYCQKKWNMQAVYTTFQSPAFDFVCTLEVGGIKYVNRETANTKKEAENFAAKAAVRALFEDVSRFVNLEKCQFEVSDRVPEKEITRVTKRLTVPSGDEEDRVLAQKVKELMSAKPNGLWSTRFVFEYRKKYEEEPPADILERIQDWQDVVKMERHHDKIILYPVLEKPVIRPRMPSSDIQKTGSGLSGSRQLDEDNRMKYDLQITTVVSPTSGESRRSVSDRGSVGDELAAGIEKLNVVASERLRVKSAENPQKGSSCQVYVSHIESCSEFYVHYSDPDINSLMDLITEKYGCEERLPPLVSAFSKGDYCMALYEPDNCWCRAVILECHSKASQRLYSHPHQKEYTESQKVAKYCVQYIDFGNTAKVPAGNMRVLVPECAKMSAQVLRCQLHGQAFSNACSKEMLDKFKELTAGDDAITMNVVEYTDNACSVEVINKAGKNVNKVLCGEGDCETPPELVYPSSQYWDVYVSYVGNVNDICLRLVGPDYSDKLDDLEDEMLKYYTENSESVRDVSVDEVYAIMAEGAFFRVSVLETDEQMVKVKYIDHGDSENVEMAQVKPLPSKFRQLASQAITCSLASLEQFSQNEKVLEKLIDMALGKVFVAYVVQREENIIVELIDTSTDEDVSINEVCLKLIADEELTPKLPQAGGQVNGIVSHVGDDGIIAVQIQGTGLDRLDELMNDIRLHYTKPTGAEEFVARPHVGKLYCAKYPMDGNWYRAIVKQVLPFKKVEVLYVDYGNCEVISVSNLREPTKENQHIRKLPYQSIECQLAGMSSLLQAKVDNSDLSKALIDMVPTNETIQIKVLQERTKENPATVELYIEGNECSVNELLLQEHGPSLAGRFIDGADVPLPSDSDTSSVTDELRNSGGDKTNNQTGKVAPRQQLGKSSAPSSHGDADNGASSSHGDGDDKSIQEGIAKLRALTDASSVADDVRSRGDEIDEIRDYDKLLLPPVLTIPDVGEFMDIHVSLVTDPNSFRCQPWSSYDDLNNLVEKMKNFYTNHVYKCPELKVGGIYAALYDDDEHWYRIQLKTILNDNMVAMYMLDLGHFDVVAVENIQPLVSEFRKLPFQAITASLAGVKPTGARYSDQAVNRFFELAYRQELVAQIVEKSLEDRDTHVKVHLYDTSDETEDVFIGQLLVDEGLCVPDTSAR